MNPANLAALFTARASALASLDTATNAHATTSTWSESRAERAEIAERRARRAFTLADALYRDALAIVAGRGSL